MIAIIRRNNVYSMLLSIPFPSKRPPRVHFEKSSKFQFNEITLIRNIKHSHHFVECFELPSACLAPANVSGTTLSCRDFQCACNCNRFIEAMPNEVYNSNIQIFLRIHYLFSKFTKQAKWNKKKENLSRAIMDKQQRQAHNIK